jgi:protein-tyrosine phosphatase
VGDGVALGRIPSARDRLAGATLVDLCAELPGPRGAARVRAIPMLDLVPPPPARLRDAADAIERARRHGPMLVCCALGFSRSAAAVSAWLVVTGRAADVADAAARLRAVRPRIVLDGAALAAIGLAAGAPR